VKLRLPFACLCIVGALVATPALADDTRAACIQAHEAGQVSRNAGKLASARTELEQCARPTCPELVRAECARLLEQVQAEQPTVLLSARDAGGHDVTAKVLLDGAPWIERLDGAAVAIDPGEHVLRFQGANASVEEHVVIRPTEKNRAITVVLAPAATATTKPPPPALPAPTSRRSFTAAYVFLGIGISAAVGFGAFAGGGYALERDREGTCAPRCTDAELVPIRVLYGLADASLAIAGVSLVVSLVMFAVAPKVKPVQTGMLAIDF
jgi:hypothetical protein